MNRICARLAGVLLAATVTPSFAQPGEPPVFEANPRGGLAVFQEPPPATRPADGLKPIAATSIDILLPVAMDPELLDRSGELFGADQPILQAVGAQRVWEPSAFLWETPIFWHRPLYFEEVNLERHGYSFGGWQTGVSAAKFAARSVALPYLLTSQRPSQATSPLGHYRPGSPAPYMQYRHPVHIRGGLVEAGLITGLMFVLP